MNVTFAKDEPEPVLAEDIVVAGTRIGEVRTRNSFGTQARAFHAVMKLEIGSSSMGLVQGFGATKEEAILEGILRARREARELLSSLDNLERALFGAKGGAA